MKRYDPPIYLSGCSIGFGLGGVFIKILFCYALILLEIGLLVLGLLFLVNALLNNLIPIKEKKFEIDTGLIIGSFGGFTIIISIIEMFIFHNFLITGVLVIFLMIVIGIEFILVSIRNEEYFKAIRGCFLVIGILILLFSLFTSINFISGKDILIFISLTNLFGGILNSILGYSILGFKKE